LPRIHSTLQRERVHWSNVYLGVAFTTLAVLLLELSLTRIFSVVFYYHFAFLAISIALFGLGVGGVLSYLTLVRRADTYRRLGLLSCSVSFVTVISLVFVLTRTDQSNWTLTLIYFASALPFVLAGMVVSLAIAETIERVDRVYFFDLIGAAAGCLALVPFLRVFGGPNTVIASAVFFAIAGALWFNLADSTRGRVAAVAIALGLVTLVVINLQTPVIDVKFAKEQYLSKETFVKWNSFSRIAIAPEKPSGMMTIFIDADASTGIANFNFQNLSEAERHDLAYQGPGFPYQIRPAAKTLIIGPGGGWDVARALASGSKDITGVEINPIIAETIMQRQFPGLSQGLYLRPGVRIVVEDGRSFVRRTSERYQVIQATLVDTWASTAAGAFALSENNLYTTDAFNDYLSHLTDDGILAFTRWGFDPPRESLRLISLARVALDRLGERDHSAHVMVVREGGAKELAAWGARDTVIISRKPFSAQDLTHARQAIALSRMSAVYLPDERPPNPFTELLGTTDPERFYERYRYDVSPVTDDRPFFFYTVQPRDILTFLSNPSGSADYKINRAVPLLFRLMAISVSATAVILLLPPAVLGSRLPKHRGVIRFLLYFICIGIGYILIQVALIQKFILLLGNPTYALTVIIFSMLIASGLGSFFSRRIIGKSDRNLGWILFTIAVLVAILSFGSQWLTNRAITWPLGWKLATTSGLIVPVAFFMGMPFPVGLSRLERFHPPAVRWAWALNAASSVLGSASAILLAIYLGLQDTLLIGGIMYVAAFGLVKLTRFPKG
jgi:hypothetical protein